MIHSSELGVLRREFCDIEIIIGLSWIIRTDLVKNPSIATRLFSEVFSLLFKLFKFSLIKITTASKEMSNQG